MSGLDKLAREIEQAEATAEGFANLVTIFFNKVVKDGLGREEALELTKVYIQALIIASKRGGSDVHR